jgi:subtilisin family serine protease/uncharacterized protein YraI
MSNLTFQYGGEEITVHKSLEQVAVKKRVTKKISKAAADAENQTGRLGGFDLLTSKRKGEKSIEKKLDKLRTQDDVAVGSHVYHFTEGGDDSPIVPNGKIYVVFAEGSDEEMHDDVFAELKLSIRERRADGSYIVSVTPDSPNPIKCAIALQARKDVKIAEPSFLSSVKFHAFALPSDNMLKDQWHLRNTGHSDQWKGNFIKKGADAKVVDAWEWMESLGSPNIRLAVSDDGFDITHPDLRGDGTKVVAPWNFVDSNANVLPQDEEDDHGTSCAGVAVAAANGLGVLGAAPNARLMPMRFKYIGDDEIEAYFKYIITNKAHVMSCSWGMGRPDFKMSTRMFNAIKEAATVGWNGRGIAVCYAAGNEGRPITGFATHPNVICVTSSNSQDVFSEDYSNYGPEATICAPSNGGSDDKPGAGITTDFMQQYADHAGNKNYVHGFGGTSSACPLIAGVCALIYSANPTLTSKQVKDVLTATTDKIGEPSDYNSNGHSHKYGYGRVNALKAVQMAAAMPGSVLKGGGKISAVVEKPEAPVAPPPKVVVDDRPPIDNSAWDSPMATVNVKELNVRGGAGTNFPIEYKMAIGSRLEVLEIVGKWVRIGRNVWVFADYLTFDDPSLAPKSTTPNVKPVTPPVAPPPAPKVPAAPPPVVNTSKPPAPPVPRPVVAPPVNTKKTGVVNIDGLNVRVGAGTAFTAVRKLSLGAKINILETRDAWYRISDSEWVFAKYIQV